MEKRAAIFLQNLSEKKRTVLKALLTGFKDKQQFSYDSAIELVKHAVNLIPPSPITIRFFIDLLAASNFLEADKKRRPFLFSFNEGAIEALKKAFS